MSVNVLGSRWFWLACLVFLATISLWVRPNLFGFDSYAHETAVCFGWFENLRHQPFANIVLDVLPCNLWVFKAIMFLSVFFSIAGIFCIVKLFYEERLAWLSVFLLLGLAPMILFAFGEFENELFAYPLIVWGIYFFLKKDWLGGFICWLSSLGFWLWAGYLVRFNFGESTVLEMNMFANIMSMWLLIPFVVLVFLFKNKTVLVFSLLAVLLWLWNAKLFVFLLPFVALSIANIFLLLQNTRNKHFLVVFFQNNLKYVYILAFICLIGWNVAFLLQQPTQEDWIAVETSLQASLDQNLPLYNDWSYGYWLWSKGSKTPNNPGSGKQINFDVNKGVYLTQTKMDCNLLYSYENIARHTNVYICN